MNFSLLSNTGGLSLVRILGTLSRTLGIVREITPIYKEMKPIISKVPIFINKLNNVRYMGSYMGNISPQENYKKIENNITSPTFFQ